MKASPTSHHTIKTPHENSGMVSGNDKDDVRQIWKIVREMQKQLRDAHQGVAQVNARTDSMRRRILGGSGQSLAGWQWHTPNRELDPTLAVTKDTVVYISPLAPIVTGGILDLDTGDLTTCSPGTWVALEDIPALVVNPSGYPAGTYYNVPKQPVSAALTGTDGNLSGDLDRTGPTLKWKQIEEVSPCLG